MSDFEQWFGGSKYTQVVYPSAATKQIALDGWNAAIASMQGEAVGVVTLADDVSQPDTSGEHKGKYQNMIYSSAPLQVGAHVFTYPPDAAAEIARLTKELGEARCQIELLGNSEQLLIKEIVELKTAISSLVDRDLTYIDGKVSDGLYWTDIQCLRNAIRQIGADASLNIKGGAE